MYVCILLSICHVCRYFQRAKEGSRSGPLQLESQVAINHMVWCWELNSDPSARATLGIIIIFPAPTHVCGDLSVSESP